VETDVYGNARFYGMKNVTMIFDGRPSFGQFFARACEEISCNIVGVSTPGGPWTDE
jgi:hypothetical protein